MRVPTNSEAEDAYVTFLSTFGSCLVSDKEWKERCVKEDYSSIVSASLEAFALLLYDNNYSYWMTMVNNNKSNTDGGDGGNGEEKQTDEGEDMSSISTDSTQPKYTSDFRCSARSVGWSREGLCFYNKVLTVLKMQRALKSNKAFDAKVRASCHAAYNKKRKFSIVVEAGNDLDLLDDD